MWIKNRARAWAVLEFAARVCDVWGHCFSAVNIGDASIGCFICVGIRNANLYGCDTSLKCPFHLGSLFAFITAMQFAMAQMEGKPDAAQTGVVLVGPLCGLWPYFVKFLGTNWINRLLPPVIGPMIIVIGLGLANSAVTNADL